MEELSTPDADVGPDVRRDGRQILFHSNRPGSLGLFDIWVAARETDGDGWSGPVRLREAGSDRPQRRWTLPRWTTAENIGPIVNSTFTEAQPAMSADRRSLYFFSNRPGGVGGADLWMTTRMYRASDHHED